MRTEEVRVSGSGDATTPTRGVGRPVPAQAQGLLFTDDLPNLPEDAGYRGPTACRAAGITYRQLDYWARTGLVEPTVRGAAGSGTQRLYAFSDILDVHQDVQLEIPGRLLLRECPRGETVPEIIVFLRADLLQRIRSDVMV